MLKKLLFSQNMWIYRYKSEKIAWVKRKHAGTIVLLLTKEH